MTSKKQRVRTIDQLPIPVPRASVITAGSIGGGAPVSAAPGAIQDFVAAHPTDVLTNRNGTYYSVNYGIVGGVGRDESAALTAMIASVGAAGGGRIVLRAAVPTQSIVLEKLVNITSNDVTLDCQSPITLGPAGGVRISGGYDEFSRKPGATSTPLGAAASAGATSINVGTGNGIYFSAGDRITIRGQNDANGKALWKDTVNVASIAGDVLTLIDELDYSYATTYPTSDYANDKSTVVVVRFSAFAVNVNAGAMTAVVGSAALFTVGDVVVVSDSRTELDMNASANYKNAANLELNRIVAVDTGTNTLTFALALCRSYLTSKAGGVARVLAVRNSHIVGAQLSYRTDQTSKNAHAVAINYGDGCTIRRCRINGLDGRRGQAIRLAYAIDCVAERNRVFEAKYNGSGEGYGITLYYAEHCIVRSNTVRGCRHNYLLQVAQRCLVIDNVSGDCLISGIDLHGVYSVRNLVANNTCIGGARYAPSVTTKAEIRIGNSAHTGGDNDNAIIGNVITGALAALHSAVEIVASSSGTTVRGNDIRDCTIGLRMGGNGADDAQIAADTLIDGNRFTRCATLLNVNGTSLYQSVYRLAVRNNVSDGNANHFAVSNITGLVIEGNTVLTPVASASVYGVSATKASSARITRNDVTGCNRGVYVKNCPAAIITDNTLGNLIDGVVLYEDTGNTTFTARGNEDAGTTLTSGSYVSATPLQITRAVRSALKTALGTLTSGVTMTAAIPVDNTTPVITNGTQIISLAVTPINPGRTIAVTVQVPYIETSVTGPVTVQLWAGAALIGVMQSRVTTGGSSGNGISVGGSYVSTFATATTVQARIGPSVVTTTITLANKFGNAQPTMIVMELE